MLSKDKVIAIYWMIDEVIKGIHHPEDNRRRIRDSEVITIAVVSYNRPGHAGYGRIRDIK